MRNLNIILGGVLLFFTVVSINAQVIITKGSVIVCSVGADYEVISPIVLTEGAIGDFPIDGAGVITLNAPAGYGFNTTAGSVSLNSSTDVSVTSVVVGVNSVLITLNITSQTVFDVITISDFSRRSTI